MKFFKSLKKYRSIPVATGCFSLAGVVPAFADVGAGAGSGAAGLTDLLSVFTQIAAWTWSEVGLLLTWILNQPILLMAMSLFFIGAIVSFFIRVFHSV